LLILITALSRSLNSFVISVGLLFQFFFPFFLHPYQFFLSCFYFFFKSLWQIYWPDSNSNLKNTLNSSCFFLSTFIF
jgi:hypothetical protein